MVHDAPASRQLRLLLSWREALLDGSADGRDRLRDLKRVEQALDFCRARHRKRVERLGGDLRAALEVDADGAQAVELRGQVEFLNSLLRAQRAEDLGGRIDLPVANYAAELDLLDLPWRGSPKVLAFRPLAYLSPSDRKILYALPFCLLLSVLAVLYFMRWRGEVRFELLPGDEMRILCTNDSSRDILLFAPWPEQDMGRAGAPRYGISVLLRETAGENYRPYPSYGTGWYYQGLPTAAIEPIRVAPGLTAEVEFRPAEIPLLGSMDGIRIEARRQHRGVSARFDFRADGG